MSLCLMLNMVSLSVVGCMSLPWYFYLQWVLGLFPVDIILTVVVYKAAQNLGNCVIRVLFLSIPKVTNFIS